VYEARVPVLAREGPFASKDIDFCGDGRAVRFCAERLRGTARVATFDDATPNAGTVVFVDDAGVRRTLDVVSAPFGLSAKDVRETALQVQILGDAGASTGVSFYVMHPVLSMESRVHNVMGLPGSYDTDQGRKQLRASIVCAHEFMRDVLDGHFDFEDPPRTALKLNERIFRFCVHAHHAKGLLRATGIDPARALVDDPRLPRAFREQRLPQMRAELARRVAAPTVASRETPLPEPTRPRRGRGPER
jgi:hypothetical protein